MKTIFLVSQGQKCSGHNHSGGNFSNKKKNYDRAPDEFLTKKMTMTNISTLGNLSPL